MLTEDILGAVCAVVVAVGGAIVIWRNTRTKTYDPDELVTVADFSNETEAGLWEMRLKSQGVECSILGTGFRRYVFPSEAYPAFSLQVKAANVNRARQILSEGKDLSFQIWINHYRSSGICNTSR